tara:strand:- start:9694 stop:9822 length:129 start_codon:yes stop_codon:yes gene_type:complete
MLQLGLHGLWRLDDDVTVLTLSARHGGMDLFVILWVSRFGLR